jgi:hypothetical protein
MDWSEAWNRRMRKTYNCDWVVPSPSDFANYLVENGMQKSAVAVIGSIKGTSQDARANGNIPAQQPAVSEPIREDNIVRFSVTSQYRQKCGY